MPEFQVFPAKPHGSYRKVLMRRLTITVITYLKQSEALLLVYLLLCSTSWPTAAWAWLRAGTRHRQWQQLRLLSSFCHPCATEGLEWARRQASPCHRVLASHLVLCCHVLLEDFVLPRYYWYYLYALGNTFSTSGGRTFIVHTTEGKKNSH